MKLRYFSCLLFASWATCGAKLDEGNHLPEQSEGKLWVLLAAGSYSWYNYRHQADVCHAYQIVKAHGVQDENIIVFMKDDIAYNKLNSATPGVIINRPEGRNVYPGVPKDYVNDHLLPELFLAALSGNAKAANGKKVVESGPNDNIFVYFADHGAPGMSEFGNSSLKATDLIRTIEEMHREKRYNKMVFYWESCESGSMFVHLDQNMNVYATTASNTSESSYACYLNDALDTYLGDCYSVHWMENADSIDLSKETLERQFVLVKKETNTSNVMEWGEMSLSKSKVSNFLGSRKVQPIDYEPIVNDAPVPAQEVPKRLLERKIATASSKEEAEAAEAELKRLMHKRALMERDVAAILDMAVQFMDGPSHLSNGRKNKQRLGMSLEVLDGCYNRIVDLFASRCYKFGCNNYLTKAISSFAAWCEQGYPAGPVMDAIQQHCRNPRCGVH